MYVATVVKTTFIDDAELVWKLTESFTQEQTAKAMGGWSREAVKDYKALKKIDSEAWTIVGASFQNVAPDDESDAAPESGASAPKAPFTEGLLRNILDLDASQQLSLCQELAKGEKKGGISKGKFKTLANAYSALITPTHYLTIT